jgi:antitoxin component of MazEF toxin-antitoxin module
MTAQSNPRKLYRNGNSTVVSIPDRILAEMDIEAGDRIVITADGSSAEFEPVTWEVSN